MLHKFQWNAAKTWYFEYLVIIVIMRYSAWKMCIKPPQCEIPLKASITDTQIRGTSLSGERSNLFTLILGFRGQKSASALNYVTLESYHSYGLHNHCTSNGARLLKFTQRPVAHYQICSKAHNTIQSEQKHPESSCWCQNMLWGAGKSGTTLRKRWWDNAALQGKSSSQWTLWDAYQRGRSL